MIDLLFTCQNNGFQDFGADAQGAQDEAKLGNLVHQQSQHVHGMGLELGQVTESHKERKRRKERKYREAESDRERFDHFLIDFQLQPQGKEKYRHAQRFDRLHFRLNVHFVRELCDRDTRQKGGDFSRKSAGNGNGRHSRRIPQGTQVQEFQRSGKRVEHFLQHVAF